MRQWEASNDGRGTVAGTVDLERCLVWNRCLERLEPVSGTGVCGVGPDGHRGHGRMATPYRYHTAKIDKWLNVGQSRISPSVTHSVIGARHTCSCALLRPTAAAPGRPYSHTCWKSKLHKFPIMSVLDQDRSPEHAVGLAHWPTDRNSRRCRVIPKVASDDKRFGRCRTA
jgi:hypothetical protein